MLATGEVDTMEKLAVRENGDVNEISRVLQLAFLAPEIVEIIVQGKQPVELTLMKLKRISHLPLDWRDQKSPHGLSGQLILDDVV